MLCVCSKTYCCYDVTANKFISSSKGLNKHVFDQSGHGPLEKSHHVEDENIKTTSTSRGFLTRISRSCSVRTNLVFLILTQKDL